VVDEELGVGRVRRARRNRNEAGVEGDHRGQRRAAERQRQRSGAAKAIADRGDLGGSTKSVASIASSQPERGSPSAACLELSGQRPAFLASVVTWPSPYMSTTKAT